MSTKVFSNIMKCIKLSSYKNLISTYCAIKHILVYIGLEKVGVWGRRSPPTRTMPMI